MTKGTRAWLSGLLSAFFSGIGGGIAAMGFDPHDFNLQDGIGKLAGISAVVGAIGVINFLAKSPLPPEDDGPGISPTTLRLIDSKKDGD